MKKQLLLFMGVSMLSFAVNARIIYVNSSATGTNNGSSWENAFSDLSTALISASPDDELWIAKGVYKPTTIVDFNSSGGYDPQEATFQIPEGVKLFGGFSGIETDREQRNWKVNFSILSGDIDNNDNDPNGDGIIERVNDILGKNAYHVLYANTNDFSTLIDGLIINAGSADILDPVHSYNDPNLKGGGYYYKPLAENQSNQIPTINNTTFKANFARRNGGGMFYETIVGDGILSGDLRSCTFVGNVSNSEGGAIYAGTKHEPYEDIIILMKRCEFFENEAYAKGGAICMYNDDSYIDSCAFVSNKTAMPGGFASGGCGGAIYLEHSAMNIFASIFKNNSVIGTSYDPNGGGAIFTTCDYEEATHSAPTVRIVCCTFQENSTDAYGGAIFNLNNGGAYYPRITSCMFNNNYAMLGGGAIANILNAPIWIFDPTITNCTFFANHSQIKGGAIYNEKTEPILGNFPVKIDNCILWNDKADTNINFAEIFSDHPITISYSLVQGSGGSGISWNSSLGIDGGHNIDADPYFQDISFPYETVVKSIAGSSPAKDAGNNDLYELELNNIDILKKLRIQNFIVDMGAVEYYNAYPKIIYVNLAASGANDGTSWTNAFTNLTNALQFANTGDQVWVAKGIYKPEKIVDFDYNWGIDSLEATFNIPDGVQFFGGFKGDENAVKDRNWKNNPTILSGDIDNNDIDPNGDGIIESVDDIKGKNAYHVVYTTTFNADTIDGFIITAGYAAGDNPKSYTNPNVNGGGLYYRPYVYERTFPISFYKGPTLLNTVFKANYAKNQGGGFFIEPNGDAREIALTISNCEFISNYAKADGGAIFYGEKFIHFTHYFPVIRNCLFIKNEAYLNGGALCFFGDHTKIDSCAFISNKVMVVSDSLSGSGGAVYMEVSNAVFNACTFSRNAATGSPLNCFSPAGGGAVYASINDGQTANMWPSRPKFLNCIFYKNIAGGNGPASGGAILAVNKGGSFHPVFTNCMFNKNAAHDEGGGVANIVVYPAWRLENFDPTYINCTFSANHAIHKGGAFSSTDLAYDDQNYITMRAKIENCILWKNTSTDDNTAEIFSSAKKDSISYSIIKGSGGSLYWNPNFGIDGGNNLDVDPLFMETSLPYGTIGYALSSESPAINSGNNAVNGTNFDLLGNPRIQNNIIDLGALEYQGELIPTLNKFISDKSDDCIIFPIPAHDQVFIKTNSKYNQEGYTVEIFNLKGQLLRHETLTDDLQNISLSGMNAGVYLLKIKSTDGTYVSNKKLVIE